VEGPSKLDKSKLSSRTSRNQIVIIDKPNFDIIGRFVGVKIMRVSDLTLFGDLVVTQMNENARSVCVKSGDPL
ncbi:MAG: TRAM domain-containing protein, partial [Planctomycetes bacterium]|nr:TRAM domain-containing protein [Planctomycetota bacterium]